MKKINIYKCPDLSLYKYNEEYIKLFNDNIYEIGGLLNYFDKKNSLNKAYKKILSIQRENIEVKKAILLEIEDIKNILLDDIKQALYMNYKIISIADPTANLEFLGPSLSSTYVDIFLLDFLYSAFNICKNKAHIHLCPHLSIILLYHKAYINNNLSYKIKLEKYSNNKIYNSLLELLLDKKAFSISGLKCIHYLGKIQNLNIFNIYNKE